MTHSISSHSLINKGIHCIFWKKVMYFGQWWLRLRAHRRNLKGVLCLRKCCRMGRPVGGDECNDINTDTFYPIPLFRRGWKISPIREAINNKQSFLPSELGIYFLILKFSLSMLVLTICLADMQNL